MDPFLTVGCSRSIPSFNRVLRNWHEDWSFSQQCSNSNSSGSFPLFTPRGWAAASLHHQLMSLSCWARLPLLLIIPPTGQLIVGRGKNPPAGLDSLNWNPGKISTDEMNFCLWNENSPPLHSHRERETSWSGIFPQDLTQLMVYQDKCNLSVN